MKSVFITFPHALGDMLLLIPALRAWCETNDPVSVIIQRRFNSSPFDNCPYVKKVYYELSDPWQDYGPHNTVFGFPATALQGQVTAEKNGRLGRGDLRVIAYAIDPEIAGGLNKAKVFNYADMIGVDIKNYTPQVFISNKDKMEAHKLIYKLVGNNPYGFIQTNSGDPDRGLPSNYGQKWLKVNKNLKHFIELEQNLQVNDLSINAMFEVMRLATGVVVPNSVFWQAAGAMGKKVDLAYFSRGEEDLNRRKYEIHYGKKEPFYNEEFYKSVVFELAQ
jgi:hypothetical protein